MAAAKKMPTAAEKLMMVHALAERGLATGQPPSPKVQRIIAMFGDTPPTIEEINAAAQDITRTGDVATAAEFLAYATAAARPANQHRQQAQARADAGVGPSPAARAALDSFDAPPTPEQIQTIGGYLRKTHGDAVGQEFETYAATAVAKQAGQPPQGRQGVLLREPGGAPDPGYRPGAEIGLAQNVQPAPLPPEARPDMVTTPARLPPEAQPGAVTTPPVYRAGGIEPGLIQQAKDVLQGTGHIVTLGAIPAPPRIVEGNRILTEGINNAGRGMVEGIADLGSIGVPKKKPRQGTTEGEKRDKNKERDLLMEAKKVQ